MTWAAEHVVGVAQGVSEDIIEDLRANFQVNAPKLACTLQWQELLTERAIRKSASTMRKLLTKKLSMLQKFAELLGEVVTDSTKKNLEMRVEAENGATAGKFDLAKREKAADLDAIHDTVHEMAKDEARHGKAFAGLLKRYFG